MNVPILNIPLGLLAKPLELVAKEDILLKQLAKPLVKFGLPRLGTISLGIRGSARVTIREVGNILNYQRLDSLITVKLLE